MVSQISSVGKRKSSKNKCGCCDKGARSQERSQYTLRSSLAPCFARNVPDSWSSVSQVSWTRAVGTTNAVKGRGSRHFSRLAMTRRMIGDEVWRTSCYKLWGVCLAFNTANFDVQDG